MTKLATREMAAQRIAAIEHRSRTLDGPVGPRDRRSPVAFVLLAAVLAVTTVSVAERIEDRVIDAPDADAPVVTPANFDTSNEVAAAVPSAHVSPLASAVLPSGAMALTLSDGAAAITTGIDAPSIELATTTIGDLDVGALADDVLIAQADDEVSYDWGDVTEWYRTAPDGIEHGYTIDAPLSDSDDLTVTVEVGLGTPTLTDVDTIALERAEGSALWYRGLIAFDADGNDLPATMAVVDGAIALRVVTTGAMYPITIDPIISDAELVRAVADAPQLTGVLDTARLTGSADGGFERVSACPDDSVMTGLTVYPRVDGSGQLRIIVPRCRALVVSAGELQLTGPAPDAPDFGTLPRVGLAGPQTRECLDGYAITGLAAEVGLLIDRVAIRCRSLQTDGTVGEALTQSDYFGGPSAGVVPDGPVDCATGFATGLQGRSGDDIVDVGLQCATVAIAPGLDEGGQFGAAVDVAGDRMVASAPFADGMATGAGRVFVYERTGEVWEQTTEIVSPSAEPSGGFGDAVALSPNGARIAIGESDRLGDLTESGRLFVFELQEGNWNLLEGPVVAPTPVAGDGFGASLAWAGDDRLVIGAPFANGTGMVYDYAVGAGTFTPIDVSLLTLVPSAGDEFGFSVAVDERPGGGHRLIVGSPGWTGVGGPAPSPDIGAVQFLDDVNGLGFVPRDLAVTSPLGPPVRLGGSVAVSGDRVAFGSSGGASITGTLYRTENGGESWIGETTVSVPKDPDTPNLSNRFVAVEGGTLALGVPGAGGSVDLFRADGLVWPGTPTDTVRPSGVEPGDLFGWATVLDGGTLVAGAPGDDGEANETPDAGAVYSVQVPLEADPFVVTTTADAGVGSLRAALVAANAVSVIEHPDPITITFDIPGPGPHTISPLSALPSIVRPVIVDGFSQTGSTPNTAPIAEPINTVIKIELSGALTPGGAVAGLRLGNGSTGSTIRGLAINRFLGRAIQISGSGGQTVSGNFVGVGPDGSSVGSAQQTGVDVYSTSNTVGGDTAGDRNLISGNSNFGIFVNASSSQNVIRGNFIGTDPTGIVAVPNGFAGVSISGPDNVVGGVVAAQHNLISGNGRGVFVFNPTATGNVIQGNWIGTDVTGATPLPNGSGTPGQAGVAVQQGATGTQIGGTAPGAGNLIASNNLLGVHVSGATTTGTSILGNRIIGNAGLGIDITDQALSVPVITSAVLGGGDLTVSGTITGATDDYRIEVFANDVCDASGFGEGQYLLASFDMSSDDFEGATAEFSTVITAPGQWPNVTATATNSAGSTSTFSGCFDTAAVPVALDFNLDLAPDAPSVLAVAPSGIAVNTLDRSAIGRTGGTTSNVAASSISSIGPKDTSLAALSLGDSGLLESVEGNPALEAIPLVTIDLEGGWDSIIGDDPDLLKEPLSSLTLGQVVTAGDLADPLTPAGRLSQARLDEFNVRGTPLSSIPLSSIALGSTPLSSIPLSSIGLDWCDIVSTIVPNCQPTDLQTLTLAEVTLRGVPLSSIPLSSIPLSSIPLSSIPLSSIPLSSIELGATPLSSIPLSSIPLSSIPLSSIGVGVLPLSSIPLSSIPLSSIPLSSIPLSSIPLSSIGTADLLRLPTSIPLSSIPLSSIGVDGTPLSSIQLQGAPLSSIPLSSILLADAPLSSIPLSSIPLSSIEVEAQWCDVLSAAGTGFDCENGADPATTTLRELSIRGVPLSSIPLSSIPLSSIPLSSIPLSSIPLSSIPLSSIPLSSIPLSSIPLSSIDISTSPLSSIPLSSIPLSSIDLAGSPLSSIPLSSIPLSSIPLSSIPLSSIPLSSIPLSSIPLSSIVVTTPLSSIPLSSIPLSSIDILGSPLSSIPLSSIPVSSIDCSRVDCTNATLGDAFTRGALVPGVMLGSIQAALTGIRLGDLAGSFDGFGAPELRAALAQLPTTLADLPSLDDLVLGDLASVQQVLDSVTLGSLEAGLGGLTFDDLVGAIVDPFTGRPVPGIETALRTAVSQWGPTPGTPGTLLDLGTLGDVTLGDLLSEGYELSLEEIAPILGFITVDAFNRAFNTTLTIPPSLRLGDLDPRLLGALTLADIARLAGDLELGDLLVALDADGLLEGVTLGDLLLALLDPASLAYGGVELADVDVASLPGDTVGSTTFAAEFTLTASSARTIELQIQTPRNASYVTGSGVVAGDGSTTDVEPTRFGDVLTWSFVAQPGVPYTISFDVLPTLTLGSTSLSGVARVVGTDISLPATASVTVVEGTEPNDFTTPDETTPAVEDVIYLTYIADSADIDVFEIDVAQNDELVVQLSNLDADLDLVLWGRRSEVGTGGALGRTSDEAPLFAVTDPDSPTSDAEPLADFPRLDVVDSSLGVTALSNADGTTTETITTGRLDAGTYYIQVFGANGATNVQPAALQLKVLEADQQPVCAPIEFQTLAAAAGVAPLPSALANADTLLLINESRLQQLHGAAGRAAVRDAADRLVAAATAPNSTLGISPAVVPVDAYPAVRAAYSAWDSAGGSCDPDAANAVVAAINAEIIDPIRDQLTHVVILGPDELIPMARLADETKVANEYDFRHEFDGDLTGTTPNGRNAFASTFWESSILSDEPYGDAAARSLGDRYLYVTDLALGRVVETPAEIADALDTYVDFDGTLDIDTATVLGYDFLADGSDAIADTLAGGDRLLVDRELALGPDPATNLGWTADRATEKLRDAATNALVSLNAHFDHYRALPAIGDQVVNFDDNLIAERVRTDLAVEPAVDLAQSLVFSMGCHSGLSVSDITIGRTSVDWAQTFGQLGALYVGNTGFGYGDTVTVAYTEQLMALFAAQLTTPFESGDGSTTVGQALAWAKNDYIAGLQTFSVYDEKAIQEATFYGLPFYRVGLEPRELPDVPANVVAPDATGTPSLQVTVDATNDRNTSDRGVYFSNTGADGQELVIVAPGRPLQPKAVADVSVVDAADSTSLATIARGAIVLDMQSTSEEVPDPVIATPIFDEAGSQPEPDSQSGVFPTKPLDITTTSGPFGDRQQIVLATGQYRSDDAVQRLDDDIDLVVYYASPASDDFTAPTIGAVESSFAGDVLTVSLAAGEGAEVDRVYVLVAENPGRPGAVVDWRGVDLARVAGNRWTGSLTLTPGTDDVEFIVQAKDTVGNVGYATNKARNFGQPNAPTVPPPPPPSSQLQVVAPPAGESGWYEGPVTLTVANTASPATVFVNNVALPGTFEAGGTFQISDSGVQNWQVVTESGRTLSGTVRIDADGSPQVILGVPAGTGTPPTYESGTRKVDVICRDTSLVSCALDIGGVAVANGDSLPTPPGSYELDYTATDAVGNVTTGTVPFKIGLVTAPMIQLVSAPIVDQLITSPITVSATFSDASAPEDSYTATIDWGDGTVDVVEENEATPIGSGSFSGSHTYAQPGSYDIVVTVTDSGGLFDQELVTVTVIAPVGAPIITGLSAPTTPQLLSDGVVIEATFSDASAPFDTFTAIVDWGDGTTSPATVTPPTSAAGTGSLVADKVYAETGVHPITVTVTDSLGASDSELYEFVVVYDPTTNGRVTGSGTYWSGPEASPGTGRWGAPAFFGYDARYKKNATLPSGQTRLRLLGQFLFTSTKYDYLIVNDAIAIAEGVGTAGGQQYRFRVQGIDNGSLDFFQITIWNPTTGAVLYDNGVLYDRGGVVLLGGITVKGG